MSIMSTNECSALSGGGTSRREGALVVYSPRYLYTSTHTNVYKSTDTDKHTHMHTHTQHVRVCVRQWVLYLSIYMY